MFFFLSLICPAATPATSHVPPQLSFSSFILQDHALTSHLPIPLVCVSQPSDLIPLPFFLSISFILGITKPQSFPCLFHFPMTEPRAGIKWPASLPSPGLLAGTVKESFVPPQSLHRLRRYVLCYPYRKGFWSDWNFWGPWEKVNELEPDISPWHLLPHNAKSLKSEMLWHLFKIKRIL